MKRLATYALILATCLAGPLRAQDDNAEESGGLLVDFLQDTLSGDGRTIKVTGLDGAFSSRATIESVTVSDDQGVWLTLNGAVLDWNRLALVRGLFSVNTLSAEEIIVARRPGQTTTDEDLPAPEATPFRVPDLPVAIELGEIRVARLELGEPVVGVAAALEVIGALALADGALDTHLDVRRLDRPGDEIRLIAAFENETSHIALDLAVVESSGGLISAALKLPGSPPLSLTAKGEGPVGDFTADIALASAGVQRVAGQVRLRAMPAPAGAEAPTPGIAFAAGIGGDLTSFLPAEYQTFFGTDTRLDLDGARDGDGRIEIGKLSVTSEALRLEGALSMAADGAIEKLDVQGGITPPQGTSVVLPMSGPQTSIAGADFSLQLDRAQGDGWALRFQADRLLRPDLSVELARVTGTGTLGKIGEPPLQGDLAASLAGIAFSDPALNTAVGAQVALDGHFALQDDGAVQFDGFGLRGGDYRATLDGVLHGLESGFEMQGAVGVGAADLSRFSGLAGMPLTGSTTARIEGRGAPLSGMFDMVLDARSQGVSTGIAQLDPLIAGQTVLRLDAARSETGLEIRDLDLDGAQLSAKASGRLSSSTGALKFATELADLALVTPKLNGPLRFSGDLTRTGKLWGGEVHLKGPQASFADLTGTVSEDGDADITFDAALHELERLVPQLAGTLTANGKAKRDATGLWDGKVRLQGPQASFADLTGTVSEDGPADITFDAALHELERLVPQLPGTLAANGKAKRDAAGLWDGEVQLLGPQASYAELTGTVSEDGPADITFDAKLKRLERLVPELAGTLNSSGTAIRSAAGKWTVEARADGPAGITSDLLGTWDEPSGQADIVAKGQVQLNLANLFISPNSINGTAQYNLSLNGTPSLDALRGRIKTSGTTVAIPAAQQTIENIAATVTLGDSSAKVDLTGGLRAGGGFRVGGNVALQPPFDGQLTVDLLGLVLTDKLSYSTSANGQLVYAGPLAGNANLSGRIEFGETDINLTAVSGAAGAAPIPPMRHSGEPGQVHATRVRAGLVETGNGNGGPVIGLNVELVASRRVYAHGFGLQAEMGGDIVIRGTTARVEPAGQIELIRGTLDILGRRLKLTRGVIALQGDLKPYVEFQSSASTSEGQATIEIAGPLDAPEVKVFAQPERPSEEALAMLLFGNRFSEMSPLVIAKMAASLAQLGSSGGGATGKVKDATGADKVDVGADAGGAGMLGMGGYLSDNVYTDFTVNTQGETELNLNLDLTEQLTVRGTVDNTGETGLGLFFERDY